MVDIVQTNVQYVFESVYLIIMLLMVALLLVIIKGLKKYLHWVELVWSGRATQVTQPGANV